MAEELATVPTPTLPKTGQIGFKEAMGIQEPYMKRKAELVPQITQAEGDIAKATQAQKETLQQGKMQAQEAFGKAEKGAMQEYQSKLESEPLPAFVPTKDTAVDLAALFSLVSVIGMVAGKSDAQMAMNAMNGMLEGYQQGRADLYKKEAATFDKNFKSMLKKHEEFRKEMEDAVKLATTDREAGMQAAELAATKAGSSIVQAQLRKGDLMGAYKLVDESEKGASKALELEAKHREKVADRAAADARAKLQRDQQERLAKIKASSSGGAGASAAQTERMTNAMAQVTGAVNAIAGLPITTTSPVVGQKEFKGLFTAPLSVLNQKMSKETSQMMAGRMVGVARNLASLETGGAATGLAGLTDSIEKGISIPAGAKMHVALDRLAEMRRIVEDSSRAALASNKYTEEQKQLIRENVEIVRAAIPFTLDDVATATIASQGKSPKVAKEDRNMTFTEYVSKYGVDGQGAKAQQPSGQSSGADPVTGFPMTNAQGWVLHSDGKGGYAYVSPNGQDYEEVEE
jgi:hypothetical protein